MVPNKTLGIGKQHPEELNQNNQLSSVKLLFSGNISSISPLVFIWKKRREPRNQLLFSFKSSHASMSHCSSCVINVRFPIIRHLLFSTVEHFHQSKRLAFYQARRKKSIEYISPDSSFLKSILTYLLYISTQIFARQKCSAASREKWKTKSWASNFLLHLQAPQREKSERKKEGRAHSPDLCLLMPHVNMCIFYSFFYYS